MNINKNGQEQGGAVSSISYTAPKDIFERCNICYDNGHRIGVEDIIEAEKGGTYIHIYKLTNTVQLDSFISILRAFETEDICFAHCDCRGYDEDDHRAYYQIQNIDDMRNLNDWFGSPFIDFDAVFCDRKTQKYRFSLVSDVNSSSLSYYVKLADFDKKYCDK